MRDKSKNQFSTNSRINGVQKSGFSEIPKKKTNNTKNVLFVFFSNLSNLNDFYLDLTNDKGRNKKQLLLFLELKSPIPVFHPAILYVFVFIKINRYS